MARPKKDAAKTGGTTAKTEAKPIQNAEVNQKTDETKKTEVDLVKEKVVEVTTEAPKAEVRTPRQRRSDTHTIFTTKPGRPEQEREVSELAYQAVVKDPQIEVRLPRDSRLVEPKGTPCKDC